MSDLTQGQRMIQAIKDLGLYDVDCPVIHGPIPRAPKIAWLVEYYDHSIESYDIVYFGYELDAYKSATNWMVDEVQSNWDLTLGTKDHEIAIDINTEIAEDNYKEALDLFKDHQSKKKSGVIFEVKKSTMETYTGPVDMIEFSEKTEMLDDEQAIEFLLRK